MPLYTVPNATAGLDDALVDTVTIVPSFIPLMLLFIWGVVFIGGMLAQRRRTGWSDAPQWMTLASLCCLMVSMFLTLKEGLINMTTLGVVIAITILSGVWLFLDRNRNEV